jgi:transposase
MAIIPQMSLFSWEDVEELGDLERLRLVLDNMPDEALVEQWEKDRKNGRDDYPLRAVWNAILAGVVFQHPTIESLRREVSRNAQLRLMCGFEGKPPCLRVLSYDEKNLVRRRKHRQDV